MSLRLPDYADLADEQRQVINLETTGNHVVQGPPGTGKSVLALYRADSLLRSDREVMMIMYNRLLTDYSKGAIRELDGGDAHVRTLDSWFPNYFERAFGEPPPRMKGHGPAFRRPFDWAACIRVMTEHDDALPLQEFDVIVDEGQDFPREAYTFLRLAGLGLTVFADENQRITPNNSLIEDIQRSLRAGTIHRLTLNYRNSLAVARVAAHFDPDRRGGVTTLGPHPPADFKQRLVGVADAAGAPARLAKFVKSQQSKRGGTFGILLKTTADQAIYYDALTAAGVTGVGLYSSDAEVQRGRSRIKFEKDGVRVVNYRSAKGLEFDVVILPELQNITDPDRKEFKRLMYVLCSRARQLVVFAYSGREEPPVVKYLPTDLLKFHQL
jgi:superfamily I DNA/RNA helicase